MGPSCARVAALCASACVLASFAAAAQHSAVPASPANAIGALQTRDARIVQAALEAEDSLVYTGRQVVIQFRDAREQPFTQDVAWDGPRGLSRIEFRPPSPMSGAVLIVNGQDQWQYDPQTGVWLHQSGLPRTLISRRDGVRMLLENYEVELAGEREVAARDCYVYDILPRLAGNPSRRICVDRETYLPLRTENVDGLGQFVSITYFERIEFHRALDSQLFAGPARVAQVREDPVRRAGPMSIPEVNARARFRVHPPDYVPPGYDFAGAFLIEHATGQAVHLQWFDGLSLISLFKQPQGSRVPETGWAEYTANSVSWVSDGFYYTLIGDIVPSELARVRDSVR